MDQILAVFVETIKVLVLFTYGLISMLVTETAKGNAFACLVLIAIVGPLVAAFLRLALRPRRPRRRR
jgi:hypothetical protein